MAFEMTVPCQSGMKLSSFISWHMAQKAADTAPLFIPNKTLVWLWV